MFRHPSPVRQAAVAFVIAIAAACAASNPAWAAAAFTSETDLGRPEVASAIERFWVDRGQPGRFSGQGGLNIAFMRFVQDDASQEKGAVVIVSGRTESMLKYKELAYDLWRNGYSIYIHDHRGQGLSEREPAVRDAPEKGHVGRFDDYVDDLRRFTSSVVAAGQHRHQYLLAHSMGGAIAALFLEGGGPEVKRLQAAVLSSPMLEIQGFKGWTADLATCRVAASEVALGRATDYIVRGGPYDPKPFEDNEYTHSRVRYERLLAQVNAVPEIRIGSPTHGWLANACDAARRARSNADKVSTPVLVLVAGKDRIVHPDGAKTFCAHLPPGGPARRCGGPGGDAVTIPEASHELFIERDDMRAPALQQVLAFFDAHRH